MQFHQFDEKIIRALQPLKLTENALSGGNREDGRKFGAARKAHVSVGMLITFYLFIIDVNSKYDGSASVGCNGTCVISGVEALITEGSSTLVLNIEKSIIYEKQANSYEFSLIQLSLKQIISAVIDFSQLLINPKDENCKSFWSLKIDVFVLESDGNLLSIAIQSVIAALLSTRIHQQVEKFIKTGNYVVPNSSKKNRYLPIIAIPSVITVAHRRNVSISPSTSDESCEASLIIDPSNDESLASSHKITFYAQTPLNEALASTFTRKWTVLEGFSQIGKTIHISRVRSEANIDFLTVSTLKNMSESGGGAWDLMEKETEKQLNSLRKACKKFFKQNN